MKYIKKFESEFTRLATHLMDDMDARYRFSGPNDNKPLTICSVEYPDGVIINYGLIENYNSDIKTITLKYIDNVSDGYSRATQMIQKKYMEIYGDVIQFETFEEYKRIRFYMNIDDLYNVNFPCYLCPPDGVKGFTEVNFKFLTPNMTYGLKKNGPWPSDNMGLFASNILKDFNSKKLNILKRNRLVVQHMFVEILEELDLSKRTFINEHKIEIENVNIVLGEYLYFYYTFIDTENVIKEILKGNVPIISNSDIYKAIMKIHY